MKGTHNQSKHKVEGRQSHKSPREGIVKWNVESKGRFICSGRLMKVPSTSSSLLRIKPIDIIIGTLGFEPCTFTLYTIELIIMICIIYYYTINILACNAYNVMHT